MPLCTMFFRHILNISQSRCLLNSSFHPKFYTPFIVFLVQLLGFNSASPSLLSNPHRYYNTSGAAAGLSGCRPICISPIRIWYDVYTEFWIDSLKYCLNAAWQHSRILSISALSSRREIAFSSCMMPRCLAWCMKFMSSNRLKGMDRINRSTSLSVYPPLVKMQGRFSAALPCSIRCS